jgi:ribosomal protein S18 acetylase RimI-like enzyme
MPMKPGQVIAEPKLKDGSFVRIRAPMAHDLDGMLAFINGLVKENAMILADKPFKRKDESAWLRGVIKGIRTGKTIYLVAEADRKIVGGADINQQPGKSKHVGLFGISITKGYRDRGLGSILAREVMKQAKRSGLKLILLEVFDSNPRAIHLYEKVGFREVGRIPKKLYHLGEYHTGIMMAKEISKMK